MDNENLEQTEQSQEERGYTPRPAWQVWSARIALVLFIALILMYYVNMMRGGL